MNKLFYVGVFLPLSFIMAQKNKVDNNFLGKYVAQKTSSLYTKFEFDNNGKVTVGDLIFEEDFFVKDDSLFIIPNKDVLIFKISKNKKTLKGISNWVKDETWEFENKGVDKRTNDSLAKNKANLVCEYYVKTRKNKNMFDLILDADFKKEYIAVLTDLCDKGYARACGELLGNNMMDEMGGISVVMGKGKPNKLVENPENIKLCQRMIELGDTDGYVLLGQYYFALGKKAEGQKQIDKAIELGSKNPLLFFNQNQLEQKTERIISTPPKR